MNINKSSLKLIAMFLVATVCLNFLFIYVANASDSQVPDWLNTDENYVPPVTVPEVKPVEKIPVPEVKPEEKPQVPEENIEEAQDKAAQQAADEAAKQLAQQEAAKTLTAEEQAKAAIDEAAKNQITPDQIVANPETINPTSANPNMTAPVVAVTPAEQLAIDQLTEAAQSNYTEEEKAVVTEVLAKELAKTEGEIKINLPDGKTASVSPAEALAFLQIAKTYAGGGKLGSDLNGDYINDSYEATTAGVIPFNEEQKKAVVDEVVYGVTKKDAGKTVIVTAPNKAGGEQVLGDEPFFKVKVVPAEGEDAAKIYGKKLSVKITSESGEVVESLVVTVGEDGVSTYKPSDKLKSGKYSVTVLGSDGEVLDTQNFEVDPEKVPAAPTLGLGGQNDANSDEDLNGDKASSLNYAQASVLGADQSYGSFDLTKYLISNYIFRVFPYLDPRNEDVLAAAGIPVVHGEVPQVIEGYAEPGSTVFITWKSVVRSSVVMADKNGKFVAESPVGPGSHEVIAFVYDSKKNLVGNATSFLFKK